MTDNQLFLMLKSFLDASFTAMALTVTVQQGYQPTHQGAPTQPTIAIYKLFDHPYGFPQFKTDKQAGTRLTTRKYETTLQVEGRAIVKPKDATPMTASDWANIAQMFLQSREFLAVLKTANAGVLRITEVRNPEFDDDFNQHEFAPSFDVVITHDRVLTAMIPFTNKTRPGVHGV